MLADQLSFNIKLIVAYDGMRYLGWQKTSNGPTIEGVLEDALTRILQQPVALQAASRTDAGVHASHQVVNFIIHKQLCLRRLHHSLNGVLPKEIAIKNIEFAATNFHPTLDCVKKEYHYQVFYGREQLPFQRHDVWHYPSDLDINAMRGAASLLVGRHDFSAFCNYLKLSHYDDFEREIYKLDIIESAHQQLRFEVCGNHFLYKMVRNLVGTLVYVGRGKIAKESILHLIASKKRSQIGMTAPALGLRLHHVEYETR